MSQTLLLADDSVTIQRVIELTFADEDVRVIAVGDGQHAIERIAAEPPDIVLADTSMPERDGYDVAQFIKADPALAHIPVVLLTGAFEPVDEDRARQVGCDAVLVKPFEPQAVISRVRELLGGRPAPAPAVAVAAVAEEPTPSGGAEPPAEAEEDETVVDRARSAESGDAPAVSQTQPEPPNQQEVEDGDPLGSYLDQMDEAFDRLAEGQARPGAAPTRRPTPDTPPRPSPTEASSGPVVDMNSLEGALSALEGALDKLDLDNLDEQSEKPTPVSVESPGAQDAAPSVPDVAPSPPEPVPETAAVAPPADEPLSAAVTEMTAQPRGATPPSAPSSPSSPSSSSLPSGPTPPTLADAFRSLLAAEQDDTRRAETHYPWPHPAEPPEMSEELIERVTERVLARLADGANGELLSQVVARVAEKVVREEIDRTGQD